MNENKNNTSKCMKYNKSNAKREFKAVNVYTEKEERS